jgi:16S rRNA (adenine1518-N6/adenine1519-N6)-dimethyltransferase
MKKKFAHKKSLGQNFLTDRGLAAWIADQIQPDRAPIVVEIGPGEGALTEHLVDRAQKLVLVEKDDMLADNLLEIYGDRPEMEVMRQDATVLDMRPWYRHGDVRVIGNLPYSVGGPILKAVLTPPTPLTRGVFMLQKEVCQRLSAKCGEHGYGGLSVLVQQHWDVQLLRIVGPEVFKPRPKVDSAVILCTRKKPGTLPVYDGALFRRLVKMGFSQRRKQLKNLLPDEIPNGGWEALAAHLGVDEMARAEELPLELWVQVARWFEGRTDVDRGQKATEMFDVVDEHNNVIGQRPRGEVHAQGLRHRAVHVFVFDKRGNVYLQKRSHLKDAHPLVWDSSAAGHLDVGESYAACAIRELKEEIGAEVETTTKLADIPATERTGMEFVELHTANYDGKIRFAPDEIEVGQWFKPATVTDWVNERPQDFATGFIECWRAWEAAQK